MTNASRSKSRFDPERVASYFADSDGYWLTLQPGWNVDGLHTVHADGNGEPAMALSDARIQVRKAERCSASRCGACADARK